MTREEAIEALTRIKWVYVGNELFEAEKEQAIEIAIEALECKPSEDGTLEVKVEDATKVGRVLISDDKHRGGLYYPDEDEPQGVSFENNAKIKSCSKDSDLISRAEAIEAMCRECGSMEEYGTCSACGCAEKNAIEALPSADRPTDGDLISRAEAIEALGEEPLVWCDEEYEIAERNQWRADIEAIESVPSADRIYADRPKGRWHYSDGKPATIGQSFGVICDQCGLESEYCTNFCGECGADMRGGTE